MANALRLRRGTTAQHASFTGLEAEVTVDTTKDTIVVHDGSTAGGIPLAKESQATTNVAITGGSITGITDLAIADGGTGASTAAAATRRRGFRPDIPGSPAIASDARRQSPGSGPGPADCAQGSPPRAARLSP